MPTISENALSNMNKAMEEVHKVHQTAQHPQ